MGKGNGWLGRLARRLVHALARFYYPHIEISGADRIPGRGPVLLAANHQNSLMDPVLVGLTARRPVSFLAKAPLFEIPLFGNLLHALGMLPAYRRSDDPSQTHRNQESLARAAARLQEGGIVGIFPEGKSHDAPRLEPVKSGAARIALQALAAGTTPLQLIPVGLNYERKEWFRSAVWVRVGEPIDIAAWRADASADDRQAVRELSAELDRRLKELVVHLDAPEWEPLLRELEILLPPPRESRRNPFAWLRQRKRLADAMNHFLRTDPVRAAAAGDAIRRGCARLAEAGLNARSSVLRYRGWRLTGRLLVEAVLMDAGFVLVLIGSLFHLLPFLLTRAVARFVQAPGRSTIALARFGVGVPVYAAWYAFHAWWMTQYFLPWVAWAWLLPMPVAGLLALSYWRRVRRTSPGWWRNLWIAAQPRRLRELRAEHDQIRARVRDMAEEYVRVHTPEPLPLNAFSWRRLARATAQWTAVGLAVFLAIAWFRSRLHSDEIHELGQAAPVLRTVSADALGAALDADELTLVGAIASLRQLETNAARLQAEFLGGRRDFYAQADNDAIRQAMLSYLSCRTSLLRLVWKYQRHEDIPDERLKKRAALVQLTAASAIADASLKLVTRFGPYPASVRKLNEGDLAWGLPPGLFDLVRRNLRQADARAFMDNALAAHRTATPVFARLDLLQSDPYAGFHETIRAHADSREALFRSLDDSPLTEPLQEAGRMTKGLAYRGQAFVSTWLGSTRFRKPRDGAPMIHPRQLEEFHARLQPGDILLERQNWFLSRAFMPGYWAHAALYVGTTNDLVRLGLDRDPRVAARWREFATPDRAGRRHLILEAVPEGVRMTTLEHCIGVADAAAVLRPRVDPARVREAIARAFSHLGKAYDFDFDFFTSDRLVCTELVYRSYDGSVQFPLVDVMGRRTLPPTELVRKFVQERGRPGAQLDCVCFLDSDERRGRAVFKDEDTFVRTLGRPGLLLHPSLEK